MRPWFHTSSNQRRTISLLSAAIGAPADWWVVNREPRDSSVRTASFATDLAQGRPGRAPSIRSAGFEIDEGELTAVVARPDAHDAVALLGADYELCVVG